MAFIRRRSWRANVCDVRASSVDHCGEHSCLTLMCLAFACLFLSCPSNNPSNLPCPSFLAFDSNMPCMYALCVYVSIYMYISSLQHVLLFSSMCMYICLIYLAFLYHYSSFLLLFFLLPSIMSLIYHNSSYHVIIPVSSFSLSGGGEEFGGGQDFGH